MPLKKSLNNLTQEVTTPRAAGHSKSKPKGKFSRLLNQYSPSPENITTWQHPKFIRDSPPRAVFWSLHRMKEKQTCLLFGPHWDTFWKSRHFRYQAKLTNFTFPTDRLVDDDHWKSSSRPFGATNDRVTSIPTIKTPSKDSSFCDDMVDESEDVSVQSHDPHMFEDVMGYVGALRMCKSIFQGHIKEKMSCLVCWNPRLQSWTKLLRSRVKIFAD